MARRYDTPQLPLSPAARSPDAFMLALSVLLLTFLVSYLLGAIPFGWLIALDEASIF